MKGVRGRIDVFGEEVAPLREEDARDAAAELLDAGVDGICVCLLFSYRNAEHEIRVGEIIEEEKAKRGAPMGRSRSSSPRSSIRSAATCRGSTRP